MRWLDGDGDEQGDLVCCDSWGRKESDTTERLNGTKLNRGKLKKKQKQNCFTHQTEPV